MGVRGRHCDETGVEEFCQPREDITVLSSRASRSLLLPSSWQNPSLADTSKHICDRAAGETTASQRQFGLSLTPSQPAHDSRYSLAPIF